MIRKRLKSTFWKTHFWNFYFFQKSKFRKSRDYRRKNSDSSHFYTIYMEIGRVFFGSHFYMEKIRKTTFSKIFKNRILTKIEFANRIKRIIECILLPQDMSSIFTFHSTFAHIINIIKKAFYISILYRIIFIRK